jgi:hypothetical protein
MKMLVPSSVPDMKMSVTISVPDMKKSVPISVPKKRPSWGRIGAPMGLYKGSARACKDPYKVS